MRVSRDEELVAWILSYMILGEQVEPSSKALNALYQYDEDSNSDLAIRMETEIARLGENTIIDWFEAVHAEMLNILYKSNKTFRNLVYDDDYSEGLVRTYQVMFLALFELLIKDKKIVSNYNELLKSLDSIALHHLKGISDSSWKASTRYQKIQAVKGILLPYFKKKVGSDVTKENWIFELDNIIRLSRIEGTQYDFKTGFHNLQTGEFNKELVLKIVEILTAEVNKGPNSKGYVIVGIIEGDDALAKFREHYSTTHGEKFEGTDFYITGIQDEIKKYYGDSGDKLQNDVLNIIRKAPIEDSVKNEIMTNFRMVKYRDDDIIVFELSSRNSPVFYNDTLYVRNGNQTKPITSAKAILAFNKEVFGTD